LPKTKPSNQSK